MLVVVLVIGIRRGEEAVDALGLGFWESREIGVVGVGPGMWG